MLRTTLVLCLLIATPNAFAAGNKTATHKTTLTDLSVAGKTSDSL